MATPAGSSAAFQTTREVGERPVGRVGRTRRLDRCPLAPNHVRMTRVLVVVTVHAKQLPVAAVRGIVVVVMIAMVHGELAQIRPRELAPAAPADPRKEPEGLFAIALLPFLADAPRCGNDPIECAGVRLSVRHVPPRCSCLGRLWANRMPYERRRPFPRCGRARAEPHRIMRKRGEAIGARHRQDEAPVRLGPAASAASSGSTGGPPPASRAPIRAPARHCAGSPGRRP